MVSVVNETKKLGPVSFFISNNQSEHMLDTLGSFQATVLAYWSVCG